MKETLRSPLRQGSALGVSSVASALLSWLTLIIVGRHTGPASFAQFMALWGAFFALAGLLAGLQQEITRSATARESQIAVDGALTPHLAVSSTIVTCLVVLPVIGASMIWGDALVNERVLATIAMLVLGFVSLGVQSALAGGLAAQGHLGALGALIAGGAVLRLVVISVATVWVAPSSVTWAVGICAGALMWIPMLTTRTSRKALILRGDSGSMEFLAAALPTMGGAFLAGVLASGLPALVRITGDASPSAIEGALLAAVIAVRTPLLLPLSAFQLPLVRRLVGSSELMRRVLLRWLGWVVALGVPAVGVAWWLGPELLALVFGEEYRLPGSVLAWVAVGSFALLCLNLTHVALIAARRQLQSFSGWVVAAVVTVVALASDLSATDRVLASIILGPLAGLAVHAFFVARSNVDPVE